MCSSDLLDFARRDLALRQGVYALDGLAWAQYQAGRYAEAARTGDRALAAGTPLGDATRAHLLETRARIKRALEAGRDADGPGGAGPRGFMMGATGTHPTP